MIRLSLFFFILCFTLQGLAVTGRVLGIKCENKLTTMSHLDGDFLNDMDIEKLYPSIKSPTELTRKLLERLFAESPKMKKAILLKMDRLKEAVANPIQSTNFSVVEEQDLLIERASACEEFVLGEVQLGEFRVSSRFSKLSSVSKVLFLTEMALLEEVDQYSPVYLRALVYSLMINDFFEISLMEQHRKIHSAGFDFFEHGNFVIDLRKARRYREDDGSLSSVKLVQNSLVRTIHGDCLASGTASSHLSSAYQASKVHISSCHLNFSNAFFPLEQNSFLRFDERGKISSFQVQGGASIQYGNLSLKARDDGMPALIYASKNHDQRLETFKGFEAVLDLFGKNVQLSKYETIVFGKYMPWPSRFQTDEHVEILSPIGSILVSNLIILGDNARFLGGVIVNPVELNIQSKRVYAAKNSFLSFSEFGRVLKFRLAASQSLQMSSGKLVSLKAGQAVLLDEAGYVVHFN